MNYIFTWFFNLGPIPDDAEGIRISWNHSISSWIWFVIILFLIIVSSWSYSKVQANIVSRFLLGSVRFASLLLLVILVAGPQAYFPRETIDEDLVMVMLDRSASMTIEDVQQSGEKISREQQLRKIINEKPSVWSDISSRSDVEWIGFSSGIYNLSTQPSTGDSEQEIDLPVLDEPEGWKTDIPLSIRQAVESNANRPVSAIILASDGRSMQIPGRSLNRLLTQQSIPVFTLKLGSEDPVHDVSVADVRHPDRAFIRDSIPVVISIKSVGSPDEVNVSVDLIDESTNKKLDSKSIRLSDEDQEVLLTARMDDPGLRNLIVRLKSDEGDLFENNDQYEFDVDVVDRPIRILYIEGYPRWEYRYLKNLLVRESSIESSVMLLSADREFAQEGNTPISRLPRTKEEIEPFDLMIIGDVPSGFFSPEQLDLFSQQVSTEGMGLFWIGGPRNTPSSWSTSSMDELLPMRSPLELERANGDRVISPTNLSRNLGVLVLDPTTTDGWVDELSDPDTGWAALHSLQIIEPDQLKPTSEVLAVAAGQSTEEHPALLSMRYGAGQVIYSAVDDIWRWRFGRGEEITDRWWIGLIRLLARQSLDSSRRVAELNVSPSRLIPGRTSNVTLELFDQRMADAIDDVVSIEITSSDGNLVQKVDLSKDPMGSVWKSNWVPDRVGRFDIKVNHPLLSGLSELNRDTWFDVVRPDDEFRILDADHDLLEKIASQSGGSSVPVDSIERIVNLLPNRDVLIENPIVVPIWNSGTFLFLLIGLLTTEWVGRRLIRMT